MIQITKRHPPISVQSPTAISSRMKTSLTKSPNASKARTTSDSKSPTRHKYHLSRVSWRAYADQLSMRNADTQHASGGESVKKRRRSSGAKK